MALSSVSVRISPEVYNEIRKVADKENITFIEAADRFVVGYEGEIKQLQKEITQLQEEKEALIKENKQLKELQAQWEKDKAKMLERIKELNRQAYGKYYDK